MSFLLTLAAEEAPAHLFMPNWAFPAIVAGAFLVLALVSWSFRDVANRHADREPFPADPHAAHGDEHASDHQAGHH
jgi:hypothetical protein